MPNEFEFPQSRNEAILQNMLGANNDLLPPFSRIEVLLTMLLGEWQEINAQIGGNEETIDSDGSVEQELEANTIYHFTGELTALTITLAETDGVAHYHFDFESGASAVTLTLPNTVIMPDGFAVETNRRYEIDILNGYGAVQGWAIV